MDNELRTNERKRTRQQLTDRNETKRKEGAEKKDDLLSFKAVYVESPSQKRHLFRDSL